MTSDIGSALLDSISSKNALEAITQVQQFKENMKDITVGADHVMWITEPANLTRVHKALAEDLDVPSRLLAIRRIQMNRTQRAVLLVQSIEMAIKKVYGV